MSNAGSYVQGTGGGITVPVTVPNGGTGQIFFPAHTVLLGEGTSPIGNAGPGSLGSILVGQGAGADPVFGTLVAGSNVTITPSGSTITISATGGGGGGAITFTDDGATTATTNAGAINLFGTSSQGITITGDGGQTITATALSSTTSQRGTVILADGAQTIAGTNANNAVTPLSLTSKLGNQTSHGVILGEGTTAALGATAAGAANTALLGQGASADPIFGAIPNATLQNSSVTLNSGNNITVTGGGPLALGGVASFNVTGTTNHAVQLGNATGSLTSGAVGSNGQVLIGSTGADPVFGTITSPNNSITVGLGAGTLTLSVNTGVVMETLTGNTGGAVVPTAGNINVVGDGALASGLTFSGLGSTLTGTIQTATNTQLGVTQLATNSQTTVGTATTVANTPLGLATKLGTQTLNGIAFGAGTTMPITWTAAGTTGQVLVANTGAAPTWGTPPASAGTITGDSGGALSQTANNWNIIGQQAGTVAVMDTIGAVSTLSIEDRTWTTQFVVDASTTPGLRGTFTTIQAAVTAAVSGQEIFIRPGTYTENVVLKNGIALNCYGSVLIHGKVSLTSGNASLRNLGVQTNGDFAVSATGGGVISCFNCAILANGNTGINVGAGSSLLLTDGFAAIQSAATAVFNIDATGTMVCNYWQISNGSGTNQPNTVAGGLQANYCEFDGTIALSGSSAFIGALGCQFIDGVGSSVPMLTFTGATTLNDIWYSQFNTATATCITIDTGANVNLHSCTLQTTNGVVVSGAGSVNYTNPIMYYTTSDNKITASQSGGAAFSVNNTAGGDVNFTGDGTVAHVTFNTESYDQSSNYSGSIFHANEPGKYMFQVCITLQGVTALHTLAQLTLVTTSSSYMLMRINTANIRCSDNVCTLTGTCCVYMSHNDTAFVTCQVSGGTKVVSTNASPINTYFMGYKLTTGL